jgi:hypothetical protein
MALKSLIKQAFENVVLCRGAHGPGESYEYAERMAGIVKESIKDRLTVILNNPTFAEEELKRLIEELG